jgi:hypothetical protein
MLIFFAIFCRETTYSLLRYFPSKLITDAIITSMYFGRRQKTQTSDKTTNISSGDNVLKGQKGET